jgi:hypothetical protein
MKIAIDLSPSQADRLRERAKSLGVQPEELARALLPNRDRKGAAQWAIAAATCPWSESPRAARALSALSAASFGVYLIHPIFIDLLSDGRLGLKLTGRSFSTFFAVPATALVTLSASFLATALLQRAPLLRRIVP